MKKYFLLLLSIILVAISCKSKLSQQNAKEQIIKSANYPAIVDFEFINRFTKDFVNESDQVIVDLNEDKSKNEKEILEKFQSAGLITFEETSERKDVPGFFSMGYQTWTAVKVLLTDEGKKYLISETENKIKVKLWETDLIDISRIQEMEQDKKAKVDYTIYNKNITPFGENFDIKSDIVNKTKYFSIHDGGWRIQADNEEAKITPEQVRVIIR